MLGVANVMAKLNPFPANLTHCHFLILLAKFGGIIAQKAKISNFNKLRPQVLL